MIPCCLVDVSVFRKNLPPPSSATDRIKRWCRQEENCAPLGYYAASSGNFIPTFRINLSVSSSGLDSWTLRMGTISCPERSVRNYHYSPDNNQAKRSSQLLCSGSLKSRWFRSWISIICRYISPKLHDIAAQKWYSKFCKHLYFETLSNYWLHRLNSKSFIYIYIYIYRERERERERQRESFRRSTIPA